MDERKKPSFLKTVTLRMQRKCILSAQRQDMMDEITESLMLLLETVQFGHGFLVIAFHQGLHAIFQGQKSLPDNETFLCGEI